MKKVNNIRKTITKEKMNLISENLYLAVLAVFVGCAFLQTTTFVIEWPEYFLSDLHVLIIVIIFIRIAFVNDYDLKEVFILAGIAILFLMVWYRTGKDVILDTLLLIIGSRGISFQKIIKVYEITVIVLLLVTIAASLTGFTENLVYYQEGRRPRVSFGIVYPTDFSAHVFYVILGYGYLRKDKIKYMEIAGILLVGAAVYLFCDARVNTVCILFAGAVLSYLTFKNRSAEKKNSRYIMKGYWSGILAMSAVLCAGFMIVSTILYSSENRILALLNRVINSRLTFGKKGIDLFGFSLFGKYIPMIGNGGTTKESANYFVLDCSYITIALEYGLLILGAVLIMYCMIGFRARLERDWVFLWILSIAAVQCMIEHHMIDISYNPFLWALFANTAVGHGNSSHRLRKDII